MKCTSCGNEFTPTDTAVRKSDHKCCPCKRLRDKAWREKRLAEGRPYVTSRKRDAEKAKRYEKLPHVRERAAARVRALWKNDYERILINARIMVRRAVGSGKLTRGPCEVCGVKPADGHHDDYNKPLEVRWLCSKHHAEWHMTNKPIYPVKNNLASKPTTAKGERDGCE